MRTTLIVVIVNVCLTILTFAQGTFHHIKISEDIEIVQLSQTLMSMSPTLNFPGMDVLVPMDLSILITGKHFYSTHR
jgi:hypothetical protein